MSPTGYTTTDVLSCQRLMADDDDTVAEWLVLLAAAAGDLPESPAPCPIDMAGSLRFAPPDTVLDDWVVRCEGRVVGSLRLALPAGTPMMRLDQLLVHPALRRQGIGRVLHNQALQRAAAHGREGLTATLVEALPDGPPRDAGPAAFAAAVGAIRSAEGVGVHQLLDLAVHDPLGAGAPAVPAGYALVTWGTVTPEEYAVPVSALEQSLGSAVALEAEFPDAVEISYARQFEIMRIGRGRRAYHTGVVHQADGRLVGYTSISMTTSNPHHALQGMTVVHTAHRGHGLGLVIKLANLRWVRRHEPALRLLETANAEDNAAMIAVNAAMGYRARDRWVMWNQRRCRTSSYFEERTVIP
jgi:GNAT superfamily N-acetyltransferase